MIKANVRSDISLMSIYLRELCLLKISYRLIAIRENRDTTKCPQHYLYTI